MAESPALRVAGQASPPISYKGFAVDQRQPAPPLVWTALTETPTESLSVTA